MVGASQADKIRGHLNSHYAFKVFPIARPNSIKEQHVTGPLRQSVSFTDNPRRPLCLLWVTTTLVSTNTAMNGSTFVGIQPQFSDIQQDLHIFILFVLT